MALEKLAVNPLKIQLVQSIKSFAKDEGAEGLPGDLELYDLFGLPPEGKKGDLAFPTFPLAKILKKAPPLIAQKLAEALKAEATLESVEAVGPYVNVTFSLEALGAQVLGPIASGEFFKRSLVKGAPKTMVEYSQPNTHKELHVGHMRNLCLGYAVAEMLRFSGFPVITATFPGDVGTHVAKCLWYLKNHVAEAWPTEDRGEWLGQMYSKAHLKLEDELGSPQEEKNREQLTLILKQLESRSGEYYDLWVETREWSIELMKSVYEWAEVSFDRWFWESEVDAPSVQWVRKLYSEGLLVESQGAVGMDLEAEGLGFCLLLKSDGNGLYATKDLELARRKFAEGIEQSLYVVDVRQALHFKQVFKVLEKIGFENAKNCQHLQYNFVELPDGAMSSRKGNIVPLMQLVDQMEKKIKDDYLSRYSDWSDKEKDLVAHQVAQGAIKYGMLKMDTNKKIVFDMKEWLKLDGDSGPFIQYSYARIQSVLRNAHTQGFKEAPIEKWALIQAEPERQLLRSIIQFHDVVGHAALQHRPALICAYLYQVAKQLNHFYHECPILKAETEALKRERLGLLRTVGSVMEQGLKLLGIPRPERM